MHHSISFILKYTNPLVQRLLTQSLKKVNQSLEDPTTVFYKFGSVAGDGGDGWDGDGEEGGDNWSKGLDHLVEAEAGGGLAPRDVDAVAEELAAIDGLGVDLGESREERVDEVWAETVLVIVTDEC